MDKLDVETALGSLQVVGGEASTRRAAAELALATAERRGDPWGAFIDFDGRRAYFKCGFLRGKTRLRYALKHQVLRRRLPRVQEYLNLSWLRERSFQAPLPLAAGVIVQRGLPLFQFLLTEQVPDVMTLDVFLASDTADQRRVVLDELAREVARMHSIGFIHHDLYHRNILVGRPEHAWRVWFIDCWAGGPAPQMRGPAYDLAGLMLRAPETMQPDEQRRFFDVYCAERGTRAPPVEVRHLIDETRRERASLARNLRARTSELRGLPPPSVEWIHPI